MNQITVNFVGGELRSSAQTLIANLNNLRPVRNTGFACGAYGELQSAAPTDTVPGTLVTAAEVLAARDALLAIQQVCFNASGDATSTMNALLDFVASVAAPAAQP